MDEPTRACERRQRNKLGHRRTFRVDKRTLGGVALSVGLLVAAVWPSGLNDDGDFMDNVSSGGSSLDSGEDLDGDGTLDIDEDGNADSH